MYSRTCFVSKTILWKFLWPIWWDWIILDKKQARSKIGIKTFNQRSITCDPLSKSAFIQNSKTEHILKLMRACKLHRKEYIVEICFKWHVFPPINSWLNNYWPDSIICASIKNAFRTWYKTFWKKTNCGLHLLYICCSCCKFILSKLSTLFGLFCSSTFVFQKKLFSSFIIHGVLFSSLTHVTN